MAQAAGAEAGSMVGAATIPDDNAEVEQVTTPVAKADSATVIAEDLATIGEEEEEAEEEVPEGVPEAEVAEMYPWMIEKEVPKKSRIKDLHQILLEGKKKGMNKRLVVIFDLMEEVRVLKGELKEILHYDKMKRVTLRKAVYLLYVKHYDLRDKFYSFVDEIDVESVSDVQSWEYNPPTPDFVKSHRFIRKMEFYIKRFFDRPLYNEKEIDREYAAMPSRYG